MNIKLLGVSKLRRKLHRPFRVYSCQNATLLETTCHGSIILLNSADTYALLTDAFETESLQECTFCKSPENGYNSPETPDEVIDHIFYKGYSVLVSMQ